MMRQFHAAKAKYPDAILFFRMGDFYEMFEDDAKVGAKALGLTLTSRSKEKDLPMAGVPVRAMEGYLVRLVKAGYTVAICEQMQDPKEAKGIVERDVVRVVSPGTLVEDENLQGDEPLFVLAANPEKPSGRGGGQVAVADWPVGLSWADISTGAFRCATTTVSRFHEELARILPAEILLPDVSESDDLFAAVQALTADAKHEGTPTAIRPPWSFDAPRGRRDLCEQLGAKTLDAFGVEEWPEILAACGGLLAFLKDTQKSTLAQIQDLKLHRPSCHLVLDGATRRTLEITRSQADGGRDGTLLSVLDHTGTPMGARLLRDWLLEPLVDAAEIGARHDAVEDLVNQPELRASLNDTLDGLGDLERLGARSANGRAGARELVALAGALGRVPDLKQILQASGAPALGLLAERLDDVNGLMARVRQTLIENPPLQMTEGGLVRDGFSADVDELRELARGGKEYLVQLQQRETERTGISSLKIGFNRVFGYYLEITNTHRDLVPDDYIRKQTLKNAERYITPELKEYEAKVLSAEEKLKDLEYKIVAELRDAAAQEATRMLATAAAVAELDVFTSLAKVAVSRRYVRPTFVEESAVLDIQGGRHPVVEAVLSDDPFVPNDTHFSDDARLSVLTGPNMSGKSTYLRQTALVVLMAQMGAFVPADSATLGLVDRIFTRLGGGDDISRGASTFMVEMVETANILRNATERSLLLLDEVGRGTSTFDGLAIAWAVCEHVHDQVNARCLFATHYHQLTDLALHLPRARNLNVAVREWGEEIVFLHRIEEGGTDRSYGIHVARLAGLPSKVLARARAVLARLEKDEEGISERILAAHEAQQPLEKGAVTPPPADAFQMGLFDRLDNADAELAAELQALDLNEVTPIAAWQWLERIRKALN